MADDYDTPWKNAVSRYFPEFMAFFFPAEYADIDWRQPVEFLDQDMAQLTPDSAIGPRRVDKLVRVRTFSAPDEPVLLHVEVQNWPGRSFAERIFIYHYRIYDRHRGTVASLAVTADSGHRRPQNRFGYDLFGCSWWLDFPVVSLSSYAGNLDRLLRDANPFALLTAAHILALRTRHKHGERYAAKLHLITRLYEHKWDRRRTMDFMRAIGWMMRLPAALEAQLVQAVRKLRKEGDMDYLLPFEREALNRGEQKGLQKGLQKGMQKGMQTGIRQGQAQVLERLLAQRFGALPGYAKDLLRNADTEQLTAWTDKLLGSSTLADLFGPPPRA